MEKPIKTLTNMQLKQWKNEFINRLIPQCQKLLKDIAVLLSFLIFASCANNIRYKAAQDEAYLIDYGYHSSLVIRDSQGSLWEFAYGDWQWFAQNNTNWWRLPKTLFWPTQATIGRKKYENNASFEQHLKRFKTQKYIFEVDSQKSTKLIKSINESFIDAKPSDIFFQVHYNLEFLRLKQERYHAFHNCNHVISQWLEKLGLEVSGMRLFSRWQFEPIN